MTDIQLAQQKQDINMAQHSQKKIVRHGSLTLLPVANGIVDIFQGPGWGGHSRYRQYKGQWFWLSGRRIDAGELPNA